MLSCCWRRRNEGEIPGVPRRGVRKGVPAGLRGGSSGAGPPRLTEGALGDSDSAIEAGPLGDAGIAVGVGVGPTGVAEASCSKAVAAAAAAAASEKGGGAPPAMAVGVIDGEGVARLDGGSEDEREDGGRGVG